MNVERRAEHRGIACAARPGRVAAAMTEAGDMPDEDLVRAEGVTVGASARRTGDPFAVGRLDQLAEHSSEHMLRAPYAISCISSR